MLIHQLRRHSGHASGHLSITNKCGVSFHQPWDPLSVGYADLDAIRANMVSAGDVAIKSGPAGKIHDLSIMGFDNCVWSLSGAGFLGKNISMDCPIGFYMATNGGVSIIKDFDINPFLTKQTGQPTELAWDVLNIAPVSASDPTCHITIQEAGGSGTPDDLTIFGSGSTVFSLTTPHGDPYRFPMWISGPSNAGLSCTSTGTGAAGSSAGWAIKNVTVQPIQQTVQFDLIGSVFACTPTLITCTTPAITSQGDWLANTGIIRISGPINNLVAGMYVSSSDPSWPVCPHPPTPCVTVTGIVTRATGPDPYDGYNGYIMISQPLPAVSGGGSTPALVTLNFSNPPNTNPSAPNTNTYTDDHPCQIQTRTAGDNGSNNPQGNCAIFHAAQRSVAGWSNAGVASSRLPSSRGGTFGAGVLLDNVSGLRGNNLFTFDHYYAIAAIDASTCDFAQVDGDAISEIINANKTAIYVTGGSRGCKFVASGAGDKPGAALVSDLYGTVDDLNDNQYLSNVSISGSGLGSLLQFGTGDISISSEVVPTDWPAMGVMHICLPLTGMGAGPGCDTSKPSEFVNYTAAAGSSTITVRTRARFGTPATDWSALPSGSPTTVSIFWTKINNGANDNPGRTSATIFADLGDATNGSAGNHFEIHHGGAILENIHASVQGNSFISTNTTGVSINAASEPKTAIYYEDNNARMLTTISADSTFANYAGQGILNLPLSYYQWFGSPQSATGFNMLGANGIGELTVQDTSNWPGNGIFVVDSEYMAYHAEDATHVIVDQRGLCGSAPVAHTHGLITFMNVLYGCPQAGQGLPQFTLDGAGNVTFAQAALAHGQAYLSLNGSNIQLCPKDGRGLIISGTMRAVPSVCSIVPTTSASSPNTFYFVYAQYQQFAIQSITQTGTTPNHPRVVLNSSSPLPDFYAGSPITCTGVTGNTEANVADDNSTVPNTSGSAYVDLTDQLYSGAAATGNTGMCSYMSLRFEPASTSPHMTWTNGVEIFGSPSGTPAADPSQTLVGAVYTQPSTAAILDQLTNRDVASWFNRRLRTCRNAWGADAVQSPALIYLEITNGGTPLHCEFVTWGQDDVGWALFGAVSCATGQFCNVSAGFNGTSAQTESSQWMQNSTGQGFPLSVSGSASLTEGKYYITELGKRAAAATSGLTAYAGGGEEVRVRQ